MKARLLLLAAFFAPAAGWAQDAAPAPAPEPAPAVQPAPVGETAAATSGPGEDAGAATPAGKPGLTGPIRARDALPEHPGQSYIFFRTSRRMGIMFMREAGAAAEAEELEGATRLAREQYDRDMERWREVEAACRGSGAAAYRCRRPRPQPEPPTDSSALGFLSPDRNFYPVDRTATFTDADGSYTYLLAVPAGSYVLYGQREPSGNIFSGVCLCMGSVRFEVGEGQVVDLGTISFPALDATGARPSERSAAVDMMENSIAVAPAQAGAELPPRLAGLTVVPAVLRAADKQANVLGLYVDRHPVLAGVLRYRRDVVIDDRTGEEPVPLP